MLRYNYGSGTFTITGTYFVGKYSTSDIDLTKVSLTGEYGNPSKYQLTATSTVEITSETSITWTLANAADKFKVNSILNQNLATSDDGTTYNFEALEGFITGVPTVSQTVQFLTQGVAVTGYIGPAITAVAYSYHTGIITITGTNFVENNDVVPANDVDATKFTITGEGTTGNTGAYQLTTTGTMVTSATSITVTLNAADKLNVNGFVE